MLSPEYAGVQPQSKRGSPVDELLIDVRSAAERLGLGRTTLYHMVQTGTMESVKCGRRRLIPVAAIEAFVEQLRKEAREEAEVA